MTDKKPIILIVDDVPRNIQILAKILYDEGYDIMMSESGQTALDMINENMPDLILLDIMMPDIDGFEVCKTLKSNTRTKHIPIIFITARTDSASIVKGFEIGGADYLTKPVNMAEMKARVKHQILLKLANDKISEYNKELKQLLEDKDELLGIAAHDMKTPLNSILGFSSLITEEIDSDVNNNDTFNKINRFARNISDISKFMSKNINDLLNNQILEKGQIVLNKKRTNITNIVINSIKMNETWIKSKNINICISNFEDVFAYVDEDKFINIVQNLVSNAIKYSPKGKSIYLGLSYSDSTNNFIRFSVKDEGEGISKNDYDKLFTKFSKLSAKPTAGESSTGLGLSIVKKLTELHNGNIFLNKAYKDGAEFILDIPDELKESNLTEYNDLKFELFEFDNQNSKNNIFNLEKYSCKFVEISDIELFKKEINDLYSKWQILIKSNIVNEIRKFGLKNRDLGKIHNIKILEDYGQLLVDYASVFDIENILAALNIYPEIINKINNKVKIM